MARFGQQEPVAFFGQLGQRGQPLHRPDIPYEVDAWAGRGQRGHGYVDEL